MTHVARPVDHHPWISREFDVPYLAGSNNAGGLTYIDRRVPHTLRQKNGLEYDPAHFLAVHEQVEHALMKGSMPYETAHRYALVVEKQHVQDSGLNWGEYQSVMTKLVRKTEHEHPDNPPPDLYTKPYPHAEAEFLKRKARG